MGEVRAEITLVNLRDAGKAVDGLIPESEVRRLTVNAVVDTGAWTLVINEQTREKLGLKVKKLVRPLWLEGERFPARQLNMWRFAGKIGKPPAKQWFCPARKMSSWARTPLRGWI